MRKIKNMEDNRDSETTETINASDGAGSLRSILLGVGILLVGILFTLLLKPLGGSPVAQDDVPQDVTYYRDIAPIIQDNCQACHRPNSIGPFSLMTYEEVADFAPLIGEVTRLRIMPPWGAAEGYGEFKNKRVLTQKQIDTIARWVVAEAPAGNPLDQPPPINFPEEWQLGTPDLELDPGGDFKVRARGSDFFRSFVLPFNPEEDVWISAIEVIPGAKEVVHHLGIYLDTEGISPKLDRQSAGLGFAGDMGFNFKIIDLWAPGGSPRFLEEGLGWLMPAGSYLIMDIHYSPDGETHLDRTRIGVYFAKGPVNKRVRIAEAGNSTFEIPAGATHHEVTARQQIRRDITIIAGWPHMHNLGKEMKAWATLPNGEIEPLVWVPNYDFHWQQVYDFKEPLALPEGSSINLIAYFDNSTNNPENPYEKPRTIRFGQRAKDEMCYFYYYYTIDEEQLLLGRSVD